MLLSQSERITYILSMPEPSNHMFEVKIGLENINEEYLDLIMPVWRPGRYLIFDFSSGVMDFKAEDENSGVVGWKKIDKSTWRIQCGNVHNITVSYKVYANEFDLRTRGLDDLHGFVNEPAIFMYTEKFRHLSVTLKIIPYSDWHVTTGLEPSENEPNTFTAPDYDYFADCPIEIGNQKDYEFEQDGKKYVISFFGEANYNIDSMISTIGKVIKTETIFWGKIPFNRYVFIIHCGEGGSGGTEYFNSTVLDITPKVFESEKSYKSFLGLVAHEFFHTWNVKQLRPIGLTPYDFTKENYTEELWFAEGCTSYYDGLMVLRSGQSTVNDFFDEISRSAEEERRRPGNRVQSLTESSFDAWVKFWKITPQRYNTESDYYSKGADVSLILDLELRERTGNKYSLDDVMRKLYERFPLGTGYTNDFIAEVCGELTGSSFKVFFDDYVHGTKPIEWEEYLGFAGLELKSVDSTSEPVVGLELDYKEGKVFIANVVTPSAADSAKLMVGDEIISVDNEKVDYNAFTERLRNMKPGDKLTLGIFRNGKYKEIKLQLKSPKVPNYLVGKIAAPDQLQKDIYESWLKSK